MCRPLRHRTKCEMEANLKILHFFICGRPGRLDVCDFFALQNQNTLLIGRGDVR